MSDIEDGSLRYFLARQSLASWHEFLLALAAELGAQMPPAELRAFFRMVGRRIAVQSPLPVGATLADVEAGINAQLSVTGWGWVRLEDAGDSVVVVHSCAPLRQAFGDEAMAWTSGLLEGLHAEWLKQLGAGTTLELRQIGAAAGRCDTLQFRLAHASLNP